MDPAYESHPPKHADSNGLSGASDDCRTPSSHSTSGALCFLAAVEPGQQSGMWCS